MGLGWAEGSLAMAWMEEEEEEEEEQEEEEGEDGMRVRVTFFLTISLGRRVDDSQ